MLFTARLEYDSTSGQHLPLPDILLGRATDGVISHRLDRQESPGVVGKEPDGSSPS